MKEKRVHPWGDRVGRLFQMSGIMWALNRYDLVAQVLCQLNREGGTEGLHLGGMETTLRQVSMPPIRPRGELGRGCDLWWMAHGREVLLQLVCGCLMRETRWGLRGRLRCNVATNEVQKPLTIKPVAPGLAALHLAQVWRVGEQHSQMLRRGGKHWALPRWRD